MWNKLATAILVLGLAVPVFAETDLSKAARAIKTGTSREKVVETLGPATWAVLPDDDGPGSIKALDGVGLQLQWHNGEKCFPVTVIFDTDLKVTGIDDGRTCFPKALDKSWLPGADYACTKEDRSALCKP